MRAVTKNFAAIDKDSKGFITKADVVAYRKTPKGKNQTL